MDETRRVIADTEELRQELISLAARLDVYVSDLRALTSGIREEHEGTGPPGGRDQPPR